MLSGRGLGVVLESSISFGFTVVVRSFFVRNSF